MAELSRPLDPSGEAAPSASAHGYLARLDARRAARKDLKRARRAARQALNVKPRLSSRRKAGILLSAGAVGLTAFTGPPMAKPRPKDEHATHDRGSFARLPAPLLSASKKLKRALMQEEGVRYTVYRDVAGYPTVGVGHLVRPVDGLSVGDTITRDQALRFLENDLKEAERGVRQLAGSLPLHQHEFDALVDLVYNVGFGNVSPAESPRLNEAIAARSYDLIAAELDYTHAGGVVARGLEFRSDRRSSMFARAEYGDPRVTAGERDTV